MKKLIFLLVLSLTATSCTLSEDTNNDKNPSKETSELSVVSNEIIDEQNDNILLESAVSSKDSSLCEGISDTEKKSECKEIITDNVIMEEAISKKDLSLCDSIKIDRYKTTCKSKIESDLKRDEESKIYQEELNANISKYDSIATTALEEGNVESCSKIEDENIKDSCIYNVVISLAKENSNPEKCNEIQNQSYRDLCKSNSVQSSQ
jgi:hypothetical protein